MRSEKSCYLHYTIWKPISCFTSLPIPYLIQDWNCFFSFYPGRGSHLKFCSGKTKLCSFGIRFVLRYFWDKPLKISVGRPRSLDRGNVFLVYQVVLKRPVVWSNIRKGFGLLSQISFWLLFFLWRLPCCVGIRPCNAILIINTLKTQWLVKGHVAGRLITFCSFSSSIYYPNNRH